MRIIKLLLFECFCDVNFLSPQLVVQLQLLCKRLQLLGEMGKASQEECANKVAQAFLVGCKIGRVLNGHQEALDLS